MAPRVGSVHSKGIIMADPGELWSAVPAGLAALGFGYLAGSIPFGLIITRLAGMEDIRNIGSGNIGATNVLRTGRKELAAATLICDALKGTLAVLATRHFGGNALALAAGFGAFLGHLFPVWLKFHGGKGVATFIGILLGFAWPVVLGYGAVWLAVAYLTRYSSLAALAACTATPLLLWAFGYREPAELFVLLAVLVWVTHRGNIARLIAGTETKIGAGAGSTDM
jgi:acyl phosphate:glycerol-3-phosphate acyltransferase